MKTAYRWALVPALFAVLTSLALANTWSLHRGDIRSGVKDSSGMAWTQSRFGVNFSRSASDADLYLNDVVITGGAVWNSDIDLNVGLDYLGWVDGSFVQNTYAFGTALTGDMDLTFEGLVSRWGEIASTVDAGFYTFGVSLFGGGDDSTFDELATFEFTIHVIDSLRASITATLIPGSIFAGQSAAATTTFHNQSDYDILTTTWYVAGFGLGSSGASDQLDFLGFDGNWFDQTIGSGESLTGAHSSWGANAGNPYGTYVGNIGIFGGLYEGDLHAWQATGANLDVVPVPEPATVTLGIGALVAAWSRRRKHRA